MERDFELEYRELKQNETPDLWNRIEAGLSEKKVATAPPENESKSIDIERLAVKKQTSWKRWGLLAAACLCVVIIFPAVMIGLTGSSKSHSSSSSGADTAASTELMESSASTEAAAESAEAFDAASDNAAAAPEEGKAETEYTENTAADVGTADAGSMAGGSESSVVEEASEEEAAEAVMPEISDGQILEGAVVQILQVDETREETVYQAVVLETDADAVIESGMQIELICNDETQYDFVREPREEKGLKKEETYEVSLQYEKDRFVVLKAAKKN